MQTPLIPKVADSRCKANFLYPSLPEISDALYVFLTRPLKCMEESIFLFTKIQEMTKMKLQRTNTVRDIINYSFFMK